MMNDKREIMTRLKCAMPETSISDINYLADAITEATPDKKIESFSVSLDDDIINAQGIVEQHYLNCTCQSLKRSDDCGDALDLIRTALQAKEALISVRTALAIDYVNQINDLKAQREPVPDYIISYLNTFMHEGRLSHQAEKWVMAQGDTSDE